MSDTQFYPAWDEIVEYAQKGPGKRILADSDTLKSVLVGLQPGAKTPPHPAPTTVFHVLEGNGWVVVGSERIAVKARETVVVPGGTPRGVEAETQMAMIVAHAVEADSGRG